MAAGESEILKKICQLGLRSASARATLRAMNGILKYRGREVTDAEVAFIRELIAARFKILFRAWGHCAWSRSGGRLRKRCSTA